nr:hypothetical protein [Tanacetum cinerariifolium]
EDKSKGKQLEDVPVVREFLDVFPEDLPGRTMTITHSGMTSEAIKELVNRRVEEADNGNGRNGGNGNPKENDRGDRLVARECTYQDFIKCQRINFKGTEGVMVPEEEDQVEKFIGGLPNNIQRNVIAAEPTRLQDAVRIANNLMD